MFILGGPVTISKKLLTSYVFYPCNGFAPGTLIRHFIHCLSFSNVRVAYPVTFRF